MDNAKKFIDFVTSKEAQNVVATQLNRRSVRNDVEGEGLESFNSIKVIKDDENWVNENKQTMLDKYKDIFTSN